MRFAIHAGVLALLVAHTAAFAEPIDDAFDAYDRGDYTTALRLFTPLAAEGDVDAQYYLAGMYDDGEGVSEDNAEAVKWYRKAADQGDANSQFALGFAYRFGEGVPKDYAEAARWYRKAADQGSSNAQFSLGYLYYYGSGVSEDYAEAARWFRKAAEQGDGSAQMMLAAMYVVGNGVPRDLVQAYLWLNLAADNAEPAEAGEPSALELRDQVARDMSPAQIAEAQRLYRDWMPNKSDATGEVATSGNSTGSPSGPPATVEGIVKRLQVLEQLRSSGAITEAEYKKRRDEIISGV